MKEESAVPKGRLRRKVKDNVFLALFKDKENIARLYRDLNPKRGNITASNIKIYTLSSIFVNGMYNDLGFVVKEEGKDDVLVLVEAQSKWDSRMAGRMIVYYINTYYSYMQNEHKGFFGKKIINPIPELYLIFTGKRKKVVNRISVCKEVFRMKDLKDLDIVVLNKESNETIYGEYVGFCNVFNEKAKNYKKNPLRAFEETVKECKKKDYLVEFLEEHEWEVKMMLTEAFDEDFLWKCYERKIREKGIAKGRKEGIKEGIEKGIKEGEISSIIKLVKKGILTKEQAAIETNMSVDEINKMIKPSKKKKKVDNGKSKGKAEGAKIVDLKEIRKMKEKEE